MSFHTPKFRIKPVVLATLAGLAAFATVTASAGTTTGRNNQVDGGYPSTLNMFGDGNHTNTSATMMGDNQNNNVKDSVLIGNGASVNSTGDGYSGDLAGVAIGANSGARQNAVAIGLNAQATYADATAIGANARASLNGVAIGTNAFGGDFGATVVGAGARADSYSIALGTTARSDTGSLVVGNAAIGSGSSLVLGNGATGSGGATVLGNHAKAGNSDAPIAIGESTSAFGYGAVATGWNASVNGPNSIAIGTRTKVTGDSTVAIGRYINVSGDNEVAIGSSAVTSNQSSIAIGNESKSLEFSTIAIGGAATATDHFATAFGSQAHATGWMSIAAGGYTISDGEQSAAFGNSSRASSKNSLAVGFGAQSSGVNSVALGANSRDWGQNDVLSIGGDWGYSRRIIGVANGIDGNDAVNMSQLNAVSAQVARNTASITAMQGGLRATFNGAPSQSSANDVSESAPSVVAATSHVSATPIVGASLGGSSPLFAADGEQTEAATASGAHSLAVGANANASAENAVAIGANSVADRANTVSVGAAGNSRQISNVAAGTQDTDAANVGQLNGAVKEANAYTDQVVSGANAYTDNAIAGANAYTDQSIASAKNEMKHYSDRAAASTLAIPSIPVLNRGEKWVGAAVGNYGTSSAVGIAAAYQATMNLNVGLGVSSASGGPVAMKAQAGYRW